MKNSIIKISINKCEYIQAVDNTDSNFCYVLKSMKNVKNAKKTIERHQRHMITMLCRETIYGLINENVTPNREILLGSNTSIQIFLAFLINKTCFFT